MKNHSKTCFIQQTIAIFILSLVCLAVPAVQATAAVRQTMGDLPIEGRYAVSASIGHDRAEYHGRMTGGAIEADNTGNTFTARFGQTGVEIGTGSSSFSLRPAAWGYGDELSWLLPGVPQAVENLVSYNRGTVQEWYVNGPLGLQQGFTVIEKPKAGLGPLTIAMALVGVEAGTVDADGRGVMLTKLDGGVQYRYSGLVVRDAAGREADAWMEAKADTLQLCVDDAGLSYPLYIDPVIQTAKLLASDGAAEDYFGSSVAISGDTVVVGSQGADVGANTHQGAAYVFVKTAEGWVDMTQTAKLTASDGAVNDFFGGTVAVSGETVVVGVPNVDGFRGSAYVFVKPAGGWADMTQTARLTAADGAPGDFFGNSIAVSADAVLVGAFDDSIGANEYQGSAYVFEKPAGGWADMTQTAKLTASDGAAEDEFGATVAISGDMVVVGAYSDDIGANANQGSAYVFEKPAGGWADMTQAAKLTTSDGAAEDSFCVVAISGDTVVVGAYGDDIGANAGQGSAYVFEKPAGGWADMTQTAKLTAPDGAAEDAFGGCVAISGDTVLVGAPYNDFNTGQNQGSAYVFVKPAGGWADMTLASRLNVAGGAADNFGSSVAVSGDTVVAGSQGTDVGANANQGSAYVFRFFGDEPTLQATDVTFSSSTAGSMTVNWTPGNGTNSIVLMKQGSAVDETPVDGITYTPDTRFGSGEQIGTGNYVVYTGSGSSVTVTGLRPSKTYYVAVYEFNNVPRFQAENYLTTNPATGSQGVKLCPAIKIYGEGSGEVELLRRYRDEVLEQTAAGGLVVSLYYKLAPMADKMIDNSLYLRQTTKRIIDMLLPSIKRRMER